MRTVLLVAVLVVLLGAVFIGGCKQRATVAQEFERQQRAEEIRILVARLKETEDRLARLNDYATNHQELIGQLLKSELQRINDAAGVRDWLQPRIDEAAKEAVEQELAKRLAAARAGGGVQVQARPPAPAPPAAVGGMRGGVPAAIYNQIAADAAKDWPGDFMMQEHVIKTQTESYRKLQER